MEQLPSHIPTLADLLTKCGTNYHLSLDLKSPDAGPVVIEVVKAVAPALLPQLWLCHPNWRVVAALRSLDPAVKLVDSTRLERIKEGPERRAATLSEHGVDCLNMHHTDWSRGLVTLFHRFERFCLAWDLQHPVYLEKLLLMGIDGVFSDWVDRMMEAIAVFGER